MQTAAGCFHTCDAWQRASALAVAAVETDTSESANDVRVADVTDEFESAQVEKVIESETETGPDLSRERVARVLDQALAATTWNVHGDEVPDWPTRLRAVELVIDLFGDRRVEAEGTSRISRVIEADTYTMTQAVFDELCDYVRDGDHAQIDRMVQAGADLDKRFE